MTTLLLFTKDSRPHLQQVSVKKNAAHENLNSQKNMKSKRESPLYRPYSEGNPSQVILKVIFSPPEDNSARMLLFFQLKEKCAKSRLNCSRE